MGGDMPIGTDSQHKALAPADKGDQPGTAWRKGVQDRCGQRMDTNTNSPTNKTHMHSWRAATAQAARTCIK